jgi:photosystem II stability/assembly factor-like uncharacterized protein
MRLLLVAAIVAATSSLQAARTGERPEGVRLGVDIHALAVDPHDPQRLYVGTGDGVFRSLDGGSHWVRASVGLGDRGVDALVVDPRDPATVYAGTNAGVFKSVDHGDTWRPASNGLARTAVLALAVGPADPRVVWAGTRAAGVFRSDDAATVWLPAGRLDGTAVRVLAPVTDALVFAATARGGVWSTADGGRSWEALDTLGRPVAALALAATVPPTLYAGTRDGGVLALPLVSAAARDL